MVYIILKQFKKYLKWLIAQKKWTKRNKHNFTTLSSKSSLNLEQVKIGYGTYGEILFETFYDKEVKLFIGNYCSVAPEVCFLLAGEHNYHNVSTYPFKFRYIERKCETLSKGDTIIGDDVWIGYGTLILSGVTIGKGAIIGAGSVVAKNVPPYAIYANGKIIKYRFTEKVIDKLLDFNYKEIEKNEIIEHSDDLYTEPDIFFKSTLYANNSKIKE